MKAIFTFFQNKKLLRVLLVLGAIPKIPLALTSGLAVLFGMGWGGGFFSNGGFIPLLFAVSAITSFLFFTKPDSVWRAVCFIGLTLLGYVGVFLTVDLRFEPYNFLSNPFGIGMTLLLDVILIYLSLWHIVPRKLYMQVFSVLLILWVLLYPPFLDFVLSGFL